MYVRYPISFILLICVAVGGAYVAHPSFVTVVPCLILFGLLCVLRWVCHLEGHSPAVLTTYWYQMATTSGVRESGPWVLAMGIAILFCASGALKIFKDVIRSWSGRDEEISIDEFDIPDTWLFGLFTIFVLGNLITHGVLASMSEIAGSLWFGAWFIADLVLFLLSLVVWKATLKRAVMSRPRPVRRDAA